jgi:hypothetical protein
VSHRLLLTLFAPMLAAALAMAVSTSAYAHYRHGYQPCVVANYHTWLRHCRGCYVPVYPGRAFRVLRQHHDSLLVWNLEGRGWIEVDAMRFARQKLCRAAGI